MENCGSCKYFHSVNKKGVEIRREVYRDVEVPYDYDITTCRLNPPNTIHFISPVRNSYGDVYQYQTDLGYTPVTPDDWCGQWKEQDNAEIPSSRDGDS